MNYFIRWRIRVPIFPEPVKVNDDEYTSEDDLTLAEIRSRMKKTKSAKSGPIKRHYKWKKRDIEPPNIEIPLVHNVVNNNSPLELFDFFWDEEIINMFLGYSNLYASQHNKPANITKEEILNFFAVLLVSGYVHVPRRRMFWENTADAHNNLVSNAISRDRFEYIFRNIHCCDNASLDKTDKFTKVRPLIKKMNDSFQRFAPLQENHSVDEAMIPYFGRHGAKQFIRGKPIRYGYKFWTGAIDSGYVVWIEPYQGAKSEIKVQYRELGLGPSVVLQYAETLLSIRSYPYHIFCDNFFTTKVNLILLCKLLM
nr:piggyBac transposable element-derived protein 3-like [Onthophagus taurus]